MNSPSIFIDITARAARAAEVPAASFVNGMNEGGSCAPGLGIATDQADLTGEASGWTLLDQFGNARTPQNSQQIGGAAYAAPSAYPLSGGASGAGTQPIFIVTNTAAGDGTSTLDGNATLSDLATGWAAA